MADVRPFRGLRYTSDAVGELGRVLCPPFDVIDSTLQTALYGYSPFNAVRLELGATEPSDGAPADVYEQAATFLRTWQRQRVLVREETPAFYLLQEEYLADGRPKQRQCLLAAVRLEEFSRGMVRPHEHTRPEPKEDRLRLMQASAANFSPLMALYRDPGGVGKLLESQIQRRPPDTTAQTETTTYRVWALQDQAALHDLQSLLEEVPLYLADGHHRYETALTYQDLQRRYAPESDTSGQQHAYDYVLMGLIELSDPGLALQGYHQLVYELSSAAWDGLQERIQELFVKEAGPEGTSSTALAAQLEALEKKDKATPAYGLVDTSSGGQAILTLRSDLPPGRLPNPPVPSLQRCDAWLLHEALLKPVLGSDLKGVSYAHDLEDVARRAMDGKFQLAFLLRPLELEVFEAVVLEGERLPPKSTYFTPKLPTGLVFTLLEGKL